MKKVYTKPEIMFESFTLSQAIAGDCDNKYALQAQGDCGLDYGGDIIFLLGITGCGDNGTGENAFETDDGTSGVCYYNPTDTNRLFNS